MAYTKIFPVRHKLGRAVSYAVNPDKIQWEENDPLAGMVDYALDREKTETRLFESAINLLSPENAFAEMMATKERYRKTGGVLGYHIIQSFAPGEVSAGQAHEIGVEFARRCFGDRFEVVVGTHLDKDHYHNHIVFNSVSFADGKKYRSPPKSYYANIRGTSDALCREYGLSIIEPEGHGKHYKQLYDEKRGHPTWHSLIKADIDEAIQSSVNFGTFLAQLKKRGYGIRQGPNITHMSIKPRGCEKRFRLDTMKDSLYTETGIRERIAAMREGREPDIPTKPRNMPEQKGAPDRKPPRYRNTGARYSPHRPRKLHGFVALYWRYCILLGVTRTRKLPNRAAFLLRSESFKLERYERQFLFLHHNGIQSKTDLSAFKNTHNNELQTLVSLRKPLYRQRDNAPEHEQEAISSEIEKITKEIKKERRALHMCRKIEENVQGVSEKCKEVDAVRGQLSQEQAVKTPGKDAPRPDRRQTK